MKSLLWLFTLTLGCGADTVQTVTTGSGFVEDDSDEDGPIIDHDFINTSQRYMEDVPVDAWVYDDGSGVFIVEVVYKREDSTVWDSKPIPVDDVEPDFYSGEIPAADVVSGGMHYYLEAHDRDGNVSFEPVEGAQNPFHFRITAD